jgi:energy-coupling factor transporter ATP-binding protein EcfA2
MPAVDVVVSSPIERTFRVDQVAGMFDLKLEKTASAEFHAEVPGLDEDWQIGVIVGPSGSGKSTVARQAFGDLLVGAEPWDERAAVVDGFGERSIKEITHVLASVGFSSPPSWVKPYAVLSNGEKFRCDLARALLADRPAVVFDEFTSVVDRTVAKIGSAAVSKAIRKGKIARKFIAITCHYDIVDWLEPDWVLDMASGRLARGRLRRPEIRLEIGPILPAAWSLFRRHHYLSTELQPNAVCFAAYIDGEPVAFSAWKNAQFVGVRKGDMREHRTVVLPDYQGVGIGNRLSEFCASVWSGVGGRAFSSTSHPAMIRYRSASPLWQRTRLGMVSPNGSTGRFSKSGKYAGSSAGRVTGGFVYCGPPATNAATIVAQARPAFWVEQAIEKHPGATVGFLARRLGLSEACVSGCCRDLAGAGAVTVERCGGGKSQSRAYYPAR